MWKPVWNPMWSVCENMCERVDIVSHPFHIYFTTQNFTCMWNMCVKFMWKVCEKRVKREWKLDSFHTVFTWCFTYILLVVQFLGHENGKQLKVTTIKITESKENKSIQSGSTGPGGKVTPPAPTPFPPPLLAMALFYIAAYTKITQIKQLVNLYWCNMTLLSLKVMRM